MLTPRLWTALVSLTVAVFILVAVEIFVSYDRAVEEGFAEANLITHSFQERVVRIFDATDEVLANLIPEFTTTRGPASHREKDYHLLFRSKLTQMPYLTAFYITDRFGNMIANSSEFPTRTVSLKDRPHIRFHIDNSESSTFIGEISQSMVNGKMFIPVTRKIFNQQGQFVGVIGAAISPNAFQSFSQDFSVPKASSTVLFRKNGTRIAATSENSIHADFEKMRENSHGNFRENFPEKESFVSFSWINNRPLLIATYLPDKYVFGDWLLESSLEIIATLLTLIGILGTIVYARFQQKNQTAQIRRSFESYQLLTALLEKSSDKMGMAFFESTSRLLADFLQVDQVFIGEISSRSPLKIKTIAYIAAGKFQSEMEYLIKDTPCERVVQGEFGVYPDHLQQTFPKDQILAELGLRSYAGVPLKAKDGTVIGLFSILDKKAMPDASTHRALMSILGHRLGAELDRYRHDRSLASPSDKSA